MHFSAHHNGHSALGYLHNIDSFRESVIHSVTPPASHAVGTEYAHPGGISPFDTYLAATGLHLNPRIGDALHPRISRSTVYHFTFRFHQQQPVYRPIDAIAPKCVERPTVVSYSF